MRLARSTTLQFAALVFGSQLVVAAATLTTVRQLTRAGIDSDAGAYAADLRDELLAVDRRGGERALRAAVGAHANPGRMPRSVVLLVDHAGRSVAGNLADWPPTVRSPGADTIELFRIGRPTPERMHVIATSLPGGRRLLTGWVVEDALGFVTDLEAAMATALAVAVALASVSAWASARLIERRVGRTLVTAKAVAEGDLEKRVATNGSGDAFEALADAVNAMLDRIAALVAELKVASDGLAHDLRSPLTRLQAALARALALTHEEEARSAVLRAADEGDRLLRMLDTALRITRLEAGIGRDAMADTDLAKMVRDIADLFEPLAEDRGLSIRAEAPETLVARANREMLAQALANLVDNAVKYGRGAVVVSAGPAGAGAALTVSDDGPGIIPADREEALRRFGRLDAARPQGGVGLGLSLASAVARLHDGTLVLEDNAPGLRVTLTVA